MRKQRILSLLRSDRFFFVFISLIVLLITTLPAVYAWKSAGSEYYFSGFLRNLDDGWSYIAKAYQGYTGSWKFTLPFSQERSSGAYIHLTYNMLGHLAAWLRIPISVVINISRVLSVCLLLLVLWKYYGRILTDRSERRMAFVIATLTLGMGWLAVWHHWTVDFWLAEAYPFLASLTNVHFPLGMALVLLLVTPGNAFPGPVWLQNAFRVVLAFLLSVFSPYGIVTAALPWGGLIALSLFEQLKRRKLEIPQLLHHEAFRRLVLIIVGGAPFVVYYLYVFATDPILGGWNQQNVTPLPVWWDMLLSFSPALLLAILAIGKAPRPLFAWFVMGCLILLIPNQMPRRFMFGFYIPLAGLAASGFARLAGKKRAWIRVLVLTCFFPTPILTLFSIRSMISQYNSHMFISAAEYQAMEWIAQNTDKDSLIFSSPEMGLFIPALTGRLVIYGHAHETVNAARMLETVQRYFLLEQDAEKLDFLIENGVDYIFWGNEEAAISRIPISEQIRIAFENQEVQIYQVESE